VKVWVRVAVSVALLAALFAVVEWEQAFENFGRVSLGTWLGVWLVFVLGHLVGAFKWRLNVNIGRAHLGKRDAVQCYSAGLFANILLPSIVGGDVLRAVLAGQGTGRPEAAIFGGLADRLIDMFSLLLLVLVGGFLVQPHVDGWLSYSLSFGLVIGIASVCLFLPLALRVRLERWPRKLRRPIGRAMVAMRRLWRLPRVALSVFALSFGIQSTFVLLNAWLGRSIGIDIPLAAWFLAWPLAKVAGLNPIGIGGFGWRESALAGILALAPMNVAVADSVTVSLLWQSVLIVAGISAGALWFVLGMRRDALRGAGRGKLFRMPPRTPETPETPETPGTPGTNGAPVHSQESHHA